MSLHVALPIVVGLAAALVLEQWPDGAITGRDRDLVARLTRAGIQRFDADGHAGLDHGDGHHEAVVAPAPYALPAVTVPTTGPEAPPGPALLPVAVTSAPPFTTARLLVPLAAAQAVPATPSRSPLGRAPPRA